MVFNGSEAFRGAGAPSLKGEVSVSQNTNRVVLDSQELNAASGAFNLCCAEAYSRFTELKRVKIHPGNMTTERDAVESCSANVFNGIQSSCLEQFEAVKSCISDNSDEWAKCAAVRRELEVCSVTNKFGELKKA
mmetsp:Transcript_2100/g.4529  ORF Transcript_2100/g.4529 Transcript_2100/m.4529 type:complete len:134 (-) Transcript_2100:232-633(-)|eukprot:CAMPEP_0172309728 /NCGR_PEP_ID=MMETSP1058-20130122/10520_1 /TAXON_ID=83371 /ORGANISM="Detonula confervacea, Strain CCMP 353" /LENGTH=133 /DNA_ID=CAMNT_0013022403 /DNA_START=81 /DNA_END=482 /DNA_ORIENTATION=+